MSSLEFRSLLYLSFSSQVRMYAAGGGGAPSRPLAWGGSGSTRPPTAENYLASHGLNAGLGNAATAKFPSVVETKPLQVKKRCVLITQCCDVSRIWQVWITLKSVLYELSRFRLEGDAGTTRVWSKIKVNIITLHWQRKFRNCIIAAGSLRVGLRRLSLEPNQQRFASNQH